MLWKIDTKPTKPETKKETAQKVTAPSLVGTDKVTVRENTEKAGVEIVFNGKPSEPILQALKANGFRWSFNGKFWYAKANPTTMQFAQSLAS